MKNIRKTKNATENFVKIPTLSTSASFTQGGLEKILSSQAESFRINNIAFSSKSL